MTDTKERSAEDELREKLAAIEHERWADWQKWVHDCMDKLPDGAFLPLELWVRWEKQIKTPYEKLSEREKQSDRNQVDRYWPLIEEYARLLAYIEKREQEARISEHKLYTDDALMRYFDISLKDLIRDYYSWVGERRQHRLAEFRLSAPQSGKEQDDG